MSLHEVLATALAQALRTHAPLGVAINGVFDAPPARAVRPYAVVEEAVLTDWSTKDMAGREGRLTIALFDLGERTSRLRALTGEVSAALAAVPRDLGEGWRIVSLDFVRSRVVREGEARTAAIIEFRVRVLQAN
ncbi:hypothetical protein FHS95_003325 [Sphingomonas naasensis]|uniref:DUF3168 domain-containing protein n=1 Tax=Sphingomonas naasensis TaxID=1344951 RepID=A0A4V3QW69_9SPHN|nr:DUF3168 domain-containing protein [Sphingomonas naasensis]NIJ21622.1 hypothetical protein [Sphingomonas naasensis]TGX41442.1 DUF3168 domain-containing protein [Sphingomonas naasensis]